MKQRRASAASIKIIVTGTSYRRANRITNFHSLRSLALFYRGNLHNFALGAATPVREGEEGGEEEHQADREEG